MSSTQPTPPSTPQPPRSYQPGDLANGYQLSTDGTWELVPEPRKSHRMRTILAVLGFATIVGFIGVAGGNGDQPRDDSGTTAQTDDTAPAPAVPEAPSAAPAPEVPAPVVPAPAPKPAAPELTIDQENAVGSARDYLDYAGFSRSGLIGQLEYEGYDTATATFAVDHVAPDWNAEAAESARAYLDYTSFSRQGLIDQLLYEGFTPEQADAGVVAAGY